MELFRELREQCRSGEVPLRNFKISLSLKMQILKKKFVLQLRELNKTKSCDDLSRFNEKSTSVHFVYKYLYDKGEARAAVERFVCCVMTVIEGVGSQQL